MPLPNILYLHSHDTGRTIQPYGYAVPTPHLQRLAEEGVLFRQAFCAAPTCSPSRAALLTGQSAHSSGMIGLAHRGFDLHDYGQHLVHTLRGAGYSSALIGVQHVARDPEIIGYDQVITTQSRPASAVAEAARTFLQGAPQKPFFLTAGFTDTHREYPELADARDARYVRPPAPLPDTLATRRDMARYMACARDLDEGMGQVLAALDEAGLAENTLVICTTDHGIAFPGMKCNLTDHGTGVMLIMRGPGGFEGGQAVDGLVSQIDLFPTLCELLGIEPPGWLQGRSFMPLVRGEAEQVNQAVYAEVTYHAAYEPKRSARTPRYRYIRRFGGRSAPVLPNCDDGESKSLWLAHGWREQPLAAEALYDVVFDPNEARNLAPDPAYAGALAEMRALLNDWMERTDDPLRRGPVPAPSGARVNDPDGLSPRETPQIVAG